MSKIPTAKEFYHQEYHHDILKLMIDFAKLHLESQLKAIIKNAKINVVPTDEEQWEHIPEIIVAEDIMNNEGIMLELDEDSIKNAYPLTNIK